MSTCAWVITKDHLFEDGTDDRDKTGTSGPHDATDAQLEQARAGAGWPFKMYDDDGILYYEGRCWSEHGYGDEDLFRPLDDFGTPNAGAVTIKYRHPDSGKWEPL
jgi:hypothetical protein